MSHNMNYIKSTLFFLFFTLIISNRLIAQNLSLKSPNNEIEVTFKSSNNFSFNVKLKNNIVIQNVDLGITISDGRVIDEKTKIEEAYIKSKNETITVPIPNKDRKLISNYNELNLKLSKGLEVVFRAYNDGIAYRINDNKNTRKTIEYEKMNLSLPNDSSTFFPWEESMYSHNERLYNRTNISDLSNGDFCSLPVLFETKNAKVLFTEASLYNYPGMFLEKNENNIFSSKFPNFVLKAVPAGSQKSSDDTLHYGEEGSDRTQDIVEEAKYISEINGKKSLPWRVFIISDDDRTFVESNLVTLLSEKSKIKDPSWIKPGKVAWDWWNANNIYGVDFEAGINQDTYKYYIDFASENNIEYILLDEGWTKSTTEIYEANPNIDIIELIKYSKSKNVGVLLWVLWKPLNEDTEGLIKLYSGWGASGVKVDFMQRNDQYMVKSYEEIAEIAAKYKFLVDYHGAFKPSGIERLWPNLLTYEGVMGNEQNKWKVDNFPYSKDPYPINPEHNLTIPFIRMAAGAMDFTPGAMNNSNRFDYKWSPADTSPPGFDSNGNPLKTEDNMHAINTRPMVLGSRAHQVAMYTVFESPLQMMCDSPTVYKKEQETVDFITQIPTIWDETIVLEGSVSDYIVVARRNKDNWYLGAMTDWTPRNFKIDLSFLEKGVDYNVEVFKDGVNTHRNALDYIYEKHNLNSSSQINISMSSGGGYSAIFKKSP